ncbi:hypothetical protein BJ508DRAFT_307552 [Ascobolus immersus RN42]|uniref:Uncharacterized protein n=1 Tax=Ascobolus immersus RN42 TaxID=1160509 RepID=A0A3N4I2X7_ASCIM|nr:hypothetical protein BJ508DRAFT_307552 [Ascobolus immersus RN42]
MQTVVGYRTDMERGRRGMVTGCVTTWNDRKLFLERFDTTIAMWGREEDVVISAGFGERHGIGTGGGRAAWGRKLIRSFDRWRVNTARLGYVNVRKVRCMGTGGFGLSRSKLFLEWLGPPTAASIWIQRADGRPWNAMDVRYCSLGYVGGRIPVARDEGIEERWTRGYGVRGSYGQSTLQFGYLNGGKSVGRDEGTALRPTAGLKLGYIFLGRRGVDSCSPG